MKKLGVAVLFILIVIGQTLLYIGSYRWIISNWKNSFTNTLNDVKELEQTVGIDEDYTDNLNGDEISAELYAPEGLAGTGLEISIARASFDTDLGLTIEFLVNNNSDNEYTFVMDCLTLNHAFINQSLAFNDIEPGFNGRITKYVSGRELDEYSITYDKISRLDGISYLYIGDSSEYIFNMDEGSNFSIVFNNNISDDWIELSFIDGSIVTCEDITIIADRYINDEYGESYRFLVSNISLEDSKGLVVRARTIKVNGVEVDGYCSIDTISNSYGYAYLSLYDDLSIENSEISVVFDILDLPTYSVIGTTDEIIIHT